VAYYGNPVPARLDIPGPAVIVRWEGGIPRVEMTEGGSAWLVGGLEAAATITLASGAELRELGRYLAEALMR
jgi:hypothetical protein